MKKVSSSTMPVQNPVFRKTTSVSTTTTIAPKVAQPVQPIRSSSAVPPTPFVRPVQTQTTQTTQVRPAGQNVMFVSTEKKTTQTVSPLNSPSQVRPLTSLAQQPNLQPKITTQQMEPQVQERRLWNLNNVLIAFIIGVVLVAVEFIAVPYYFNGDFRSSIILALSLLIVYAVILFFLLEPKILREVKYSSVKTIETPVLKEVNVDRPVYKTVEKIVDRPVIRTVERPVIHTRTITKMSKPIIRTVTKMSKPVVRTVTKNVIKYRMKPRVKLNIPHYDYTGSTESKVYHTTSCRLGKMLKRKYALHANTQEFFKKRKFRPCEVCILKNKKI